MEQLAGGNVIILFWNRTLKKFSFSVHLIPSNVLVVISPWKRTVFQAESSYKERLLNMLVEVCHFPYGHRGFRSFVKSTEEGATAFLDENNNGMEAYSLCKNLAYIINLHVAGLNILVPSVMFCYRMCPDLDFRYKQVARKDYIWLHQKGLLCRSDFP